MKRKRQKLRLKKEKLFGKRFFPRPLQLIAASLLTTEYLVNTSEIRMPTKIKKVVVLAKRETLDGKEQYLVNYKSQTQWVSKMEETIYK